MHFTQLFIQRPVFSAVLNLLVVLMGILAYQHLPLREYPKIDVPVVSVTTYYGGANSATMEADVSQVLEEALSGIDGIDFITTASSDATSTITVRFVPERDPEAAANDVRDRVARVRSMLPSDAEDPVIAKVAADAEPMIWLALSSTNHSDLEVSEFADRKLKDKLEVLPGVAKVFLGGERKKALRVWLDQVSLVGYGLTTQDLENRLRAQNISFPAGTLGNGDREFSVLPQTELKTISDFENLILKESPSVVRLIDVAVVEFGPANDKLVARYNGKQALGLGLIKQATANPLEVAKEVKQALPLLIAGLPQGMQLELAYDATIFISQSITKVFQTLAEAIVLVILVIYFFLRNWRATLIPMLTIPISLMGSMLLLQAFGASLNTLTLLALVLAIGLVVDDAIVVVENVHRHLEKGLSPKEAAIVGGREIGLAIVAMTLTLAAVFLPVIFADGQIGRLFSEFGIALAGSVFISGFVALTLSLMLCAKWLRLDKEHRQNWVFFQRFLLRILSAPKKVLGLAAIIVALAVGLFTRLPEELAPQEDRGFLLGIALAPEGSTMHYTDRYVKYMEANYGKISDIERYFTLSGYPSASQSFSFVGLKPWGERRPQAAVAQELGMQFFQIPGILAFPINPPSFGGEFSHQPISFVVQTSDSYGQLNERLTGFLAKLRENPRLINIDVDLKLNKPQLNVQLDRDKMADLKINVLDLGHTIETIFAGKKVSHFLDDGKRYDVIVQGPAESRADQSQMSQILLKTGSEAFVPLGNIATIQETVVPRDLHRFNKMRSATMSATPIPGYSLGEALSFVEKAAQDSKITDYDFAGESREFKKSQGTFWKSFLLAMIVVYLVLAAQFESFSDPLIILCTAPLAVFGALMSQYTFGGTLNIYSQVGLIALIGLITKHGILIVEFANVLLKEGLRPEEAVYQSVLIRFRPILMTTAATVLGALPLVLSSGAGKEARYEIGLVIVGGMIGGSLLTLVVLPTVYVWFKKGSILNFECPRILQVLQRRV